jgi:hypothetical protein
LQILENQTQDEYKILGKKKIKEKYLKNQMEE